MFLAGPSAPGSWADSFYANNGFEDDEETIIKTFSFALHPVLQSNLTGLRNNLGQKRELQNYPKLLTCMLDYIVIQMKTFSMERTI